MSSNQNPLLVPISIFIVGFIAGLVFAIGIKIGIEPDEFGVGLYILQSVCTTLQNDSSLITYNCSLAITIFIIMSVIVTILSIIFQASRMDDFRVGLIIYFAGFIVGTIYIFYYVQ